MVYQQLKRKKESEVTQSCPILCDPMDCSLTGSSFHGSLQARILEWVAISFSRGSFQLRNRTLVSHILGRHFNLWGTREAHSQSGLIYYIYIICVLLILFKTLVSLYVLSHVVRTQSYILHVQFSSVVSESLWPHGLQHARLPCPPPIPGAYSNSCPLSQWCHPIISSSVVLFSSHFQSFPASESFQMSQHFTSGGQSIGVSASASVLPMNIQDWFPLGWTGWISSQSKELSRVFSNTTVKKHQFFDTQLSLQSNSHIHTWLLEKP